MKIAIKGNNPYFFEDAFFGTAGLAVNGVSSTPSVHVVRQPESGATTTATGTGFTYDSNNDLVSGTITGLVFRDINGKPEAVFSGFSWSVANFIAALDALDQGNAGPIATLIGSGTVFDASAPDPNLANPGFDMRPIAPLMSILDGTEIIGSPGNDVLLGSSGDDMITPGAAFTWLLASSGDDTIDFTGASGDDFYELDYGNNQFVSGGAITVDIDGAANTASVAKQSGTDTLLSSRDAMTAATGGLKIHGGSNADVFNVSSGPDGWISLQGWGGNDTYNLTLDGTVRLDYRGSITGIQVDLNTGAVSNDGVGGSDTINILGGSARLQLRGTDQADTIIGSGRNEVFILRGGNDTLDAGGGTRDEVRYDRTGVTAVRADLTTGTIIGTWDGAAFTHQVSNVEDLRGSRQGDDNLTGNGTANRLRGMGGNDTLTGGAGDDTLLGGAGDDLAVLGVARSTATISATANGYLIVSAEGSDVIEGIERVQFSDGIVAVADLLPSEPGRLLVGGDGTDSLNGGNGDDTISGGGGDDSLWGGGGDDNIAGADGNDSVDGGLGNDSLGGGLGNDTLIGSADDDVIGGGMGDDLILGGTGNDILAGGAGNDTIFGEDGADNIGASFGHDSVDGGAGNDSLGGGTGRDTIDGGTGHDNIGGGEGDDVIDGGAGNDFLAGGGRHDVIDGGIGNDTINGGDGDDVMTGGAGADVFVFNDFKDGDADVITDWTNGEDRFRMSGVDNAPGSGLAGYLDALNITDVAGGVEMTYQGHVILLNGARAAELGLEDFTFL